jgi:hypothetical protein
MLELLPVFEDINPETISRLKEPQPRLEEKSNERQTHQNP